MNNEKILAFLNLDKDGSINKSIAKILIWFDICFTLAVMIISLLLCENGTAIYNVGCLCLFVITDIIFAIWYSRLKIPTQIYKYGSVVMFITILKLLYGSIFFIWKNEEKVSFFHLIIFIACIILSFVNIIRRRKYLKDLEIMSIKETKKKWDKKDKGMGVFVLPISTTVFLVLILSRFLSNTILDNIGLGFILWAIACLWSIPTVLFVQNWILVKKYKTADVFMIK